MKKSLLSLMIISLVLNGCNKEQLIEGFIPEYKRILYNTPVEINTTGSFLLDGISSLYPITVTIYRGKPGFTHGNFQSEDSVILISLSSQYSICYTINNSVAKYATNDNIDFSKIYTSSGITVAAFNKHMPYANNQWINSEYANTTNIRPDFKIKEEGYAGLKIILSEKIYYVWLLIECSNEKVMIKGYAFKTFEEIRAGE